MNTQTWKTLFDGEATSYYASSSNGCPIHLFEDADQNRLKAGDIIRVTLNGVGTTYIVEDDDGLLKAGNEWLGVFQSSTYHKDDGTDFFCQELNGLIWCYVRSEGTYYVKFEVLVPVNPVNPEFSLSTGNGFTLYGGIEAPTVPKWDKTAYPNAVLIANYDENNVTLLQAHLMCVDKPFSYDATTGKCKTDSFFYQWYTLESKNKTWIDKGLILTSPEPSMGLNGNVYQRMWTNVDIENYLVAIDPVEISSVTDKAVSVTFHCDNLDSTEPVYQVKLSLNGVTWESELFAESNHKETHVFTGLEPNTEYEVYGVLFANGEETEYDATVTFTTLGTDEMNTGFNSYMGIDNVTRQIKSCFIGVNNVAREVSKIYLGDGNGIARLVFKGNMSLAELPVGSSVFMTYDGVPTEFLVVHQGNPDATMYDSSCDDTWLLMKNVCGRNMMFGTNVDDFQTSDVRLELNDVIFFNFDPAIQNLIKQVKIPHYKSGSNASVASGANGLPSKLFLLSGYEIGWTTADDDAFPVDGAVLDYFKGCAADDPKRIAYDNSGDPACWWLRSIVVGSYKSAWSTWDGEAWAENFTTLNSIRPALIIPRNVAVDSEFNIIV